jgi:serine/threonine protein kinase
LNRKVIRNHEIGEGGMGVVWKAEDTTLNRRVAIKLPPPAFSEDPEWLARFEREAKLLASLNHVNIAAIYGIHQADAGATPDRVQVGPPFQSGRFRTQGTLLPIKGQKCYLCVQNDL